VKYEEWINKCLSLPTEVIEMTDLYGTCTDMLMNVKGNLDNNLYGQNLVKERVLEVLTAMWTNPNRTRNCMVFLGDPGVGKTALARELATSIGLPFYQISFGGAKDSAILKGHGFTYIGSKPGEIVESLINMGVKNGILYLDELDKIKDSLNGQEVINSLLHILDYTQNVDFKDNYLHGIPIDLSKLIIIISINSIEVINNVLADRLPIVTFENYTVEDKIEIGTNFLIPRVIKNLNLDPNHVKYTRNSVAYIISKSIIKESGVRQLERNISTIFERINVLIQLHKDKRKKKIKMSYNIPRFKLPLTLNKKAIDYLFEEYIY
jgi:ATP-dependent Lon protease